MGIHDVTLEAFGGWTLPLIIMGIIFVIWLIAFILLGVFHPKARWKGDERGYGDWTWYVRFYSILGLIIIEFVILFSALNASTEWDDKQQAAALASVGVENVTWDAKNYREFKGTVGEDIVSGYFIHVEGEQWKLIVGEGK